MHQWTYIRHGQNGLQEIGPVSEAEFGQHIRRGFVRYSTEVMSPTRTDGGWVTAGEIPNVADRIRQSYDMTDDEEPAPATRWLPVLLPGIVICAMIAVCGGFIWQASDPNRRVAAPRRQSAPAVDRSAATQAKRHELINGLISERYFVGVEVPGRSTPRVRVTQKFLLLSTADKRRFLGVVWAYYCRDSMDTVRIYESTGRKEIGYMGRNGYLHWD